MYTQLFLFNDWPVYVPWSNIELMATNSPFHSSFLFYSKAVSHISGLSYFYLCASFTVYCHFLFYVPLFYSYHSAWPWCLVKGICVRTLGRAYYSFSSFSYFFPSSTYYCSSIGLPFDLEYTVKDIICEPIAVFAHSTLVGRGLIDHVVHSLDMMNWPWSKKNYGGLRTW